MTGPNLPLRTLPFATRVAMLSRLLAIQGAWNYELLLGTGVAFCTEPALRSLPGGRDGEACRAALARQARYFNAHPYTASFGVAALARAELDGVPPVQIERFRTAICGPLGSIGDQLVWAGWLPFCSLLALVAFGAGAPPIGVVLLFLGLYNVGHLALRVWGFQMGWRFGMQLSRALAHPVLRHGPAYIARAAAFLAGLALPLVLQRTVASGRLYLGGTVLGAAAVGFLLVRLHGRAEGWRVALVALSVLAIYSAIR
ncbi:MAG: PTS system mannose/fructose/sorbose family transporter subunit IID [Gemmatimonadaceae bacterium]